MRIFERDGDIFTQIPNADILPTYAQRVDITKDGRFSAVAMTSGTPSVNIYDNQFKLDVFSADNIISDVEFLGYALENGIAGETKQFMSIFGPPTTAPLVELTTQATGLLSSPPPVDLLVEITNTTNSPVEVEALLFDQNSPNILLGENNLPTTLNPNQIFGPTFAVRVNGNTATYILQVRIKEAGKAFSTFAEDTVEIV